MRKISIKLNRISEVGVQMTPEDAEISLLNIAAWLKCLFSNCIFNLYSPGLLKELKLCCVTSMNF